MLELAWLFSLTFISSQLFLYLIPFRQLFPFCLFCLFLNSPDYTFCRNCSLVLLISKILISLTFYMVYLWLYNSKLYYTLQMHKRYFSPFHSLQDNNPSMVSRVCYELYSLSCITYNFVIVWASLSLCKSTCMQMHMDARWRCWISWSWNYRCTQAPQCG